MLWALRLGPGQQDAEPGDVGVGGPHLLALDHPLVPVAARPGWSATARSEPAPGSLNSWHQISSPASSGSR